MKDFFLELFLYNHLVNDKIIEVMLSADKVPLRATQLTSHILLVHESWNNRMLGKVGLNEFWKEIPLNEMHSINLSLLEATKNIISNNDLNDIVSYKNTKGIEFTNTFKDVLFHVVNHNTYHKGQINVHFRNAGIEPVIADYIFYKR